MALRSRSKTSDTRIKAAKRRTQVLQLRESGLSHKDIGKRMGFSEQRSLTIVQEELNRLNTIRTETADQVRRLELNRLDKMLKANWPKAEKGDFKAIS